MKNYTYNGQQASFAIRTMAGVLNLSRGVTASVSKELHQAAKKHPVVQALIKTGELTVTGEFAPEQPKDQADSGNTAANTDPEIHSLNGATVVDAPVTSELASAAAEPESGDAPAPAGDNSAEDVTNTESAPKPPTIPQLKKQLDEAGIKYEANAKRDELVALLPKQG